MSWISARFCLLFSCALLIPYPCHYVAATQHKATSLSIVLAVLLTGLKMVYEYIVL